MARRRAVCSVSDCFLFGVSSGLCAVVFSVVLGRGWVRVLLVRVSFCVECRDCSVLPVRGDGSTQNGMCQWVAFCVVMAGMIA